MSRRVVDRQKVEAREYIARSLQSNGTNLSVEVGKIEEIMSFMNHLLQGSQRSVDTSINAQCQKAVQEVREAISSVSQAAAKTMALDVSREVEGDDA